MPNVAPLFTPLSETHQATIRLMDWLKAIDQEEADLLLVVTVGTDFTYRVAFSLQRGIAVEATITTPEGTPPLRRYGLLLGSRRVQLAFPHHKTMFEDPAPDMRLVAEVVLQPVPDDRASPSSSPQEPEGLRRQEQPNPYERTLRLGWTCGRRAEGEGLVGVKYDVVPAGLLRLPDNTEIAIEDGNLIISSESGRLVSCASTGRLVSLDFALNESSRVVGKLKKGAVAELRKAIHARSTWIRRVPLRFDIDTAAALAEVVVADSSTLAEVLDVEPIDPAWIPFLRITHGIAASVGEALSQERVEETTDDAPQDEELDIDGEALASALAAGFAGGSANRLQSVLQTLFSKMAGNVMALLDETYEFGTWQWTLSREYLLFMLTDEPHSALPELLGIIHRKDAGPLALLGAADLLDSLERPDLSRVVSYHGLRRTELASFRKDYQHILEGKGTLRAALLAATRRLQDLPEGDIDRLIGPLDPKDRATARTFLALLRAHRGQPVDQGLRTTLEVWWSTTLEACLEEHFREMATRPLELPKWDTLDAEATRRLCHGEWVAWTGHLAFLGRDFASAAAAYRHAIKLGVPGADLRHRYSLCRKEINPGRGNGPE